MVLKNVRYLTLSQLIYHHKTNQINHTRPKQAYRVSRIQEKGCFQENRTEQEIFIKSYINTNMKGLISSRLDVTDNQATEGG